MQSKSYKFGSSYEAIIYSLLLLIVLWIVFWADHLFPHIEFYKFGVLPQTKEGIKGIFFMPFIHSNEDFKHILNNSLPTVILLGTLIYYYREIALRVILFSWFFTGIGLWAFAANTHSYHIGISGIIYALAAFLFTSGALRKFKPLQGISLFVAFVYGSMIWGIFPTEEQVSWEGHLSGLVVGFLLALFYRKKGPQAPKYLYEIEKELGITPPDLEGEYNRKIELLKERERIEQELKKEREKQIRIVYHFKPKTDQDQKQDDESEDG